MDATELLWRKHVFERQQRQLYGAQTIWTHSSPLLYEVEAWKLIKANNSLVMKFGFF
jgi:hypothetical protein